MYTDIHVHSQSHACLTCKQKLIEANAMVLPGRVPGYKRSDIQLLPSSTTKHQVWDLYQQAAAAESTRPVSYSMFTSLWRQLLPHVVVMKPMSDLCWICQQNSTAISRSANRPEEKTLVHNTSSSNFHRHLHKKNHDMYNDGRQGQRKESRGRERGGERERNRLLRIQDTCTHITG